MDIEANGQIMRTAAADCMGRGPAGGGGGPPRSPDTLICQPSPFDGFTPTSPAKPGRLGDAALGLERHFADDDDGNDNGGRAEDPAASPGGDAAPKPESRAPTAKEIRELLEQGAMSRAAIAHISAAWKTFPETYLAMWARHFGTTVSADPSRLSIMPAHLLAKLAASTLNVWHATPVVRKTSLTAAPGGGVEPSGSPKLSSTWIRWT